jgi:putative spermidine/putrescine transport system ATP-binding protein
MKSGKGSHGGDKAPASLGSNPYGISLVGLSKHYGSVRAVDDVSLDITPGEFLTLLGPSGSGKTTVLMLIAGFAAPTGGDIVLDGESILHLLPEQRDFGVVFQGYALFPHMTVWENVAYPLKVRRFGRAEIDERVRQALDLVELGALRDRMPKQLSGGQQQRVALARALVFEPKVLLLDEPLGALDKKLRATLQLELRELHARLGATFINVTHDQEEALTMSDRIAVMREGEVIQVGRPEALFERPRTRFVADFLGRSNFLAARVVGCDSQILDLDCRGHPLVQSGAPRTGR